MLERVAEFIKTTLPGDQSMNSRLAPPMPCSVSGTELPGGPRVAGGKIPAISRTPPAVSWPDGGMNDAFLLSETLAAVLKGEAGEESLDRYATLAQEGFSTR